jgi:hypothetical protein
MCLSACRPPRPHSRAGLPSRPAYCGDAALTFHRRFPETSENSPAIPSDLTAPPKLAKAAVLQLRRLMIVFDPKYGSGSVCVEGGQSCPQPAFSRLAALPARLPRRHTDPLPKISFMNGAINESGSVQAVTLTTQQIDGLEHRIRESQQTIPSGNYSRSRMCCLGMATLLTACTAGQREYACEGLSSLSGITLSAPCRSCRIAGKLIFNVPASERRRHRAYRSRLPNTS